jgi:uncharacterized protein YbcI
MLCALEKEDAVSETLQRPQSGMRRFQWPSEEAFDFHIPHGEMLRLLRQTGFEVEALHELQAPDGPEATPFFVSRSWARRWPCEHVWDARITAKARPGRRPTSSEDLVVVLLAESFTRAEKTLAQRGEKDAIEHIRRRFQQQMAEDFTSVVEQATGRKVRVFLSETNVELDVSVETFLLANERTDMTDFEDG